MYDKEQDSEVNPTASLLNFQRNTETPPALKGDKSKRSLIPYVDDPESRSFALAAGLFQLFAYICVIPHIISVAISIHMLRHNLISKGIRRVTIFCVFELLAFTLVPFFTIYYHWIQWVAFLIWLSVALVCGVPRVGTLWKYKKTVLETPHRAVPSSYEDNPEAHLLSRVCFVSFVFSFLIFPQIISASVSLHMVRKKFIVKRNAEVVVCAVMELLGILQLLFAMIYVLPDSYCDFCHYPRWIFYTSLTYWIVFTFGFGIVRVMFSLHYHKTPIYGSSLRNIEDPTKKSTDNSSSSIRGYY